MDYTQEEQSIVHELLKCSREIGRKEKYKDRVRLFVFVSWIITAVCLFYFLNSPSSATGTVIFFGSITIIGHLIHYFIKQDIFRLHKKYNKLEKDLNSIN